jgi:hypothetical protein
MQYEIGFYELWSKFLVYLFYLISGGKKYFITAMYEELKINEDPHY